jgi:glutathione S-transferase
VAEADNYFDKATDPVVEEAFSKEPGERDAARLASALETLAEETALFTGYLRGDFLVGPVSAADFALYPLVAFLDRCARKLPDFDPKSVMTPEFAAWKARVEALPYFDKTYPPHWRK